MQNNSAPFLELKVECRAACSAVRHKRQNYRLSLNASTTHPVYGELDAPARSIRGPPGLVLQTALGNIGQPSKLGTDDAGTMKEGNIVTGK